MGPAKPMTAELLSKYLAALPLFVAHSLVIQQQSQVSICSGSSYHLFLLNISVYRLQLVQVLLLLSSMERNLPPSNTAGHGELP